MNLSSFLTSVQTNLTAISTTVAIICMVVLGLMAMTKFNKTGSFREVLSGFGVVVFGVLLVSAGTALVTVFMALGASLK